ncbi:CDP-glycerol glycerophosphotransferase family protein [Vibrio owensii]|uniref:CDP-glycerol glycerophosphotransferase family protein n=1 Tax=Vibrio owensii TaxID=696485 RepID=UPI0005EF5BE6|nr:CDP-glycerol glycerophosphotransferase family protein [Vibrio owensii]
MKKIARILFLPLSLIAIFFPKRKNIAIFSKLDENLWGGNAKYLSAFMKEMSLKGSDNVEPYILTAQKRCEEDNEVYIYSLKGIHLLLCAKWVFFHHGPLEFLIPLFPFNRRCIHLNHGIHYKRSGYASEHFRKQLFPVGFYIPEHIVSSNVDALAACSFYHLKLTNCHTFGLARNDIISLEKEELPQYVRDEIDELHSVLRGRRAILYAPTWRKGNTSRNFSKQEYQKLNDYLSSTNSVFLYAGHPLMKERIVEESEFIIDANNLNIDIQVMLRMADVLITDYSSAWIDYALKEKGQLIGFCYDLNEYLDSERNFIFDFKSSFPGEIASNVEDLIKLLLLNKETDFTIPRRFFYSDPTKSSVKEIMKFIYKENSL